MKLSLRQLEAEERRYAILVGKAQSIVGQASVAVGLVSSLIGGVFLREGKGLRVLAPTLAPYIALSVVVSIGLGILAVLVAAFAQRVTKTRELSMDDILSKEELEVAHNTLTGRRQPDPAALQRYRRFVTAHIWLVRARLVARHGSIANQVMVAQWLFWAFVATAGLAGILMSNASLSSSPTKGDPHEQRVEQQPVNGLVDAGSSGDQHLEAGSFSFGDAGASTSTDEQAHERQHDESDEGADGGDDSGKGLAR